ncbi:phage tail protein [Marinomonas posidonica]|uniref:phage tail-collar fiber domain-containing protein n=1 Tax=Marinomonas posidonica TaxID=936476 RepID=UPI003736DF16
MAFITIAGENQIAKKQGDNATLNITKFVLAFIDGLGSEPATRIESIPDTANVVDQLDVTKSGYVNTNQVVYSLVMGSNVGNYNFNWIGLVDDEGVLIAVSYVPTIQKRKNDGGIAGNTITRNFLIAYTGIQQTTSITVPAETWQIDFSARLSGIDERERLSNLDIYGHEGFLGDGWKVTGANGTYSVAAGVGYVGGIRIKNAEAQEITTNTFPNEIWLNVSLQGDISDLSAVAEFVIDTGPFEDYTDENGVVHYLTKIAELDEVGDVVEGRNISLLNDSTYKRLFEVSGTENNIILTSKESDSIVTALKDYNEFTFVVPQTNTNKVTIAIDGLGPVALSGIASANQLFKSALLTVRFIAGEFYVVEQVNPKTGNNVLDIAKLWTDTTDILRPGEYALDGSTISSNDHPIACAIAAASSNYIEQATKDADPITYGGYYGFMNEEDGSITVSLPIVGGEFIRMFDDGRGVDDGRVFGSMQKGTVMSYNERWDGTIHSAESDTEYQGNSQAYLDAFGMDRANPQDYLSIRGLAMNGASSNKDFLTNTSWGGGVARPHNIAYYGKTRL